MIDWILIHLRLVPIISIIPLIFSCFTFYIFVYLSSCFLLSDYPTFRIFIKEFLLTFFINILWFPSSFLMTSFVCSFHCPWEIRCMSVFFRKGMITVTFSALGTGSISNVILNISMSNTYFSHHLFRFNFITCMILNVFFFNLFSLLHE